MSTSIATAVIGQDYALISPDGYKLKGTYKGYLPTIQRYEFAIKIGNGEGTSVYFHKDTFDKYKLEPEGSHHHGQT